MGRMADFYHQQAIERFAEAMENLTYEHFCRGSDLLKEDGRELVAGTFQILSAAFKRAAEVLAQDNPADDAAQPSF